IPWREGRGGGLRVSRGARGGGGGSRGRPGGGRGAATAPRRATPPRRAPAPRPRAPPPPRPPARRRRPAGARGGGGGPRPRDRVRTVLDQRAKALLALATGLFRAGLLGPRAPQIERAHQGGAHPLEVVLDDVVRGARLDVFRRGFFVQAAGHDDDRRVRRLEE